MPASLPLDAVALRAELEQDLLWRESELRFFENRTSDLNEEGKSQYRRSMALLLYAHLEGFCKIALAAYARAITSRGYVVKDVNFALGAAALAEVFKRFRDNDRKSDIFRRTLPDDSKLHRFCRERDFLEQLNEFEARTVEIEIDEVIDMESNAKPSVLRKILYRLGLDEGLVDTWEGDLNQLLNYRNGIAHGSLRRSIDSITYDRLRLVTWALCNKVMQAVFRAAANNDQLRSPMP